MDAITTLLPYVRDVVASRDELWVELRVGEEMTGEVIPALQLIANERLADVKIESNFRQMEASALGSSRMMSVMASASKTIELTFRGERARDLLPTFKEALDCNWAGRELKPITSMTYQGSHSPEAARQRQYVEEALF